MLNNFMEIKKIKDVHSKIMSKQTNSPDPILIPSQPFQKTWDEKDLPPLHINGASASHITERSCAWILAHNGFDCNAYLLL